MSSVDIEAIEREIEEIISKAEEKRLKIIGDARRKAEEIMGKPIPVDTYRLEAENIVEKANREAEEIVEKARKEAEEIKNSVGDKRRMIVEKIVKIVIGVE